MREPPAEEALLTVLLKKGLLSTEQVRLAQVYSQEHNRDLRQSILELNLISAEVLNQLAVTANRLHHKITAAYLGDTGRFVVKKTGNSVLVTASESASSLSSGSSRARSPNGKLFGMGSNRK